jgi:hypothetical protein
MEPIVSDLCIPRIERNISYKYIQQVLFKLNVGKIQSIVEIPLKNEEDYKRVLITVQWHRFNPTSLTVRKRLDEGKSIKVVYDSPWYWKIVEGRSSPSRLKDK